MPGMSKLRTPATRETRNALERMLKYLKDHGYSNADIGAEAGGVTAPAVRKWLLGSIPSDGSMAALRTFHAKVERENTKSFGEAETSSREVSAPVTSVPTHCEHTAQLAKEGKTVGELIQLRLAEIPGIRYPELELCLHYHRAAVAEGEVGPEVIVGARRGRFESSGCADWDGPQWWKALLLAESKLDASFAGPSSGSRLAAKPLKKPRKPPIP
jgi:hypothetical protein